MALLLDRLLMQLARIEEVKERRRVSRYLAKDRDVAAVATCSEERHGIAVRHCSRRPPGPEEIERFVRAQRGGQSRTAAGELEHLLQLVQIRSENSFMELSAADGTARGAAHTVTEILVIGDACEHRREVLRELGQRSIESRKPEREIMRLVRRPRHCWIHGLSLRFLALLS